MIYDKDGRVVAREPATPETRDYKEGVDFTISQYQGKYPNYECVHCQFSTLYKDKLDEHFAYETYHQHKWAHPVPPDQQKPDEGPKEAKY